MIRSGLLLGVLAAIALGAVLSQRPADAAASDPPRREARRQALASVALAADAELERLEAALQEAIDRGRQASALTVAGEERPSPAYEVAASAVESAAAPASAAGDVVAELRAVQAAAGGLGAEVPVGASAVDLLGIASQLREAAPAADEFVELRLASARTLSALDEALASLEAEEPDAALEALDAAADARTRVAGWEEPPAVLPVWLETTGRVIDAARDIARATLDGDLARAESAVAAYRMAIDGARQADVALALAISETGAGVAVTPLRRLADAAAATAAQRAAVASVLQEAS
jgi:hypothetical protein